MLLFQFFHASQFFPSSHLTFPCCPLFLPCLTSLDSWGCSTIAAKSCSACSSMQFLFIHIMGLVVCGAKFGVTLTGFLCRQFTAAKKKKVELLLKYFPSMNSIFILQIIKMFKLCYCHGVRKGDCANYCYKICKYMPGYYPCF